jgi:hypothetical protein
MPTNIIGAGECEAMGAAAASANARYVLRLYITGTTSLSTRWPSASRSSPRRP